MPLLSYGIGVENKIGSIDVGKLADLIVLDQNLFEIDPHDIHKAKVLLTMMDGKALHSSPPISTSRNSSNFTSSGRSPVLTMKGTKSWSCSACHLYCGRSQGLFLHPSADPGGAV